jgi:hypothetical protein
MAIARIIALCILIGAIAILSATGRLDGEAGAMLGIITGYLTSDARRSVVDSGRTDTKEKDR